MNPAENEKINEHKKIDALKRLKKLPRDMQVLTLSFMPLRAEPLNTFLINFKKIVKNGYCEKRTIRCNDYFTILQRLIDSENDCIINANRRRKFYLQTKKKKPPIGDVLIEKYVVLSLAGAKLRLLKGKIEDYWGEDYTIELFRTGRLDWQ